MCLSAIDAVLTLRIKEDGPGLSADAMVHFGQRRDTRLLFQGLPRRQTGMSLGLGSVIIKAIVELHGGHYEIANGEGRSEYSGARLGLTFPRRYS
ncbi:ATP-binding protein [Undibacterium sp. Ji42W]|uniref:ATP-binding protein n=1 Tax=Undibacterium sp. Ji42W TaxID=3413039 RepID=UPI003BF25A97